MRRSLLSFAILASAVTAFAPVAAAGLVLNAKNSVLAMARPETAVRAKLIVRSPAFRPGASIPAKYSGYQDNISPALSWSKAPNGAASYALLIEDPDAAGAHPVIHWVAWNIPIATHELPAGIAGDPEVADPKGMRQGRNTHGSVGYAGPHPPVGDKPHHYHVQIFALSASLALKPDATREELLAAMANKVVAKGELVGTFAQQSLPVKK